MWLPLGGGKLCRIAAVMRGVAYYAQTIFDFPNISEEISEDQGAQLKRNMFSKTATAARSENRSARHIFIDYFKFTLNV